MQLPSKLLIPAHFLMHMHTHKSDVIVGAIAKKVQIINNYNIILRAKKFGILDTP